jgi:hypothetical protein
MDEAGGNCDAYAGVLEPGSIMVVPLAGEGRVDSRGATVAWVALSSERHGASEQPVAGVSQVASAVDSAAITDLSNRVQAALGGLRIEIGTEEGLRYEVGVDLWSVDRLAALFSIGKVRRNAAGFEHAAHSSRRFFGELLSLDFRFLVDRTAADHQTRAREQQRAQIFSRRYHVDSIASQTRRASGRVAIYWAKRVICMCLGAATQMS